MKKSSYFILGLATGAAVGAAASLLLAPAEGSHVRDTLSFRLSRLRDKLAGFFTGGSEDDMLNEARDLSEAHTFNTIQQAREIEDKIAALGREMQQAPATTAITDAPPAKPKSSKPKTRKGKSEDSNSSEE